MIDIVDDGRVRAITFQRPEAKNAMNTEMWDGTAEAFLAAADDPGSTGGAASRVRVLVLHGRRSHGTMGLPARRGRAVLRRQHVLPQH